MRIYKLSEEKIEKIKIPEYVYHGSPYLFKKFDIDQTAQRLLWFAEDIEEIRSGVSGALSSKYIYKVRLKVTNPASRKEYEDLFLDQIRQLGFDSIELEGYWAVFDDNNVEIVDTIRG